MTKIKVLVVEDSALIAEDISYKLGKHHFDVVQVCDKGEDALEFLKTNDPDLVLLDIRLAGALDGISTGFMASSLSATKSRSSLPIALFTSTCQFLIAVSAASSLLRQMVRLVWLRT